MRIGLLAMEEFDNAVEAGENTEAQVEAGAAEVAQDSNEIQDTAEQIATAGEGAEELGEIHEVMADSVEEGTGMDETAARVAEVAVESICNRLGVYRRTMPKMESFGSRQSRVQATKLAMEGIKDRIIEIFKAIKKVAVDLFNRAKAFFAKLFQNADGMIKSAEDLKKKWEEEKNTKEKESSLSIGAASVFSVDNKADVNTAKAIIGGVAGLFKNAADGAKAISGLANRAITMVESKPEEFAKVIDGTLEILAKGLKTAPVKDTKDNVEIRYYKNLPSGKSFFIKTKTGEGAEEAVPTFGIEQVDKNLADKIPALKKSDAINLLDGVIAMFKDLQKNEGMLKEVENLSKNNQKFIDQAIKLAEQSLGDTDSDKEKSKQLKVAQKASSAFNTYISQTSVNIPSMVFSAGKAGLDWARASLNNLESDKK